MYIKKSILWFGKDEEGLNSNRIFFNKTNLFSLSSIDRDGIEMYKHFNVELDAFTYAFENSMWDCFWTCMDYIDIEKKTIKIFKRNQNEEFIIPITELHVKAAFTIFKYLGSVEGQRERIKKCISLLEENYKGTLINHPQTMKYFTEKKYFDDMMKAGFPNLIKNTFLFDNKVTYEELVEKAKEIDNPDNFIIKPTTGELANSLIVLTQANEDYLRRKENKVGGWILQTISPHIWNGEYRLIFFGDMCTLGLKKIYLRSSPDQKIPIEKERVFVAYMPNKTELEWAAFVRQMWEKHMNQKIFYFRLDFVKDDNEKPYMLEFEALNPGFGFSAIPEKERRRVANEFVSFLNFYPF